MDCEASIVILHNLITSRDSSLYCPGYEKIGHNGDKKAG